MKEFWKSVKIEQSYRHEFGGPVFLEHSVFLGETVCKTIRSMLSDRCLSVCSVCPVLPLGMEVDLGPGHIVLDGDPAPPKGVQPPILGPYLLWPHGWMDQDATWYGGRPRPRQHC